MQLLTLIITMLRARLLARQFRDVRRRIGALSERSRARLSALTLREIGQATRCDFPHLYGTAPEARYLPWGQGTETGYERACSPNAEVSVRGIALWLAVAYHETKNAPHPSLQLQHRQLMQLLRELKEAQQSGDATNVERWMQAGEAA